MIFKSFKISLQTNLTPQGGQVEYNQRFLLQISNMHTIRTIDILNLNVKCQNYYIYYVILIVINIYIYI